MQGSVSINLISLLLCIGSEKWETECNYRFSQNVGNFSNRSDCFEQCSVRHNSYNLTAKGASYGNCEGANCECRCAWEDTIKRSNENWTCSPIRPCMLIIAFYVMLMVYNAPLAMPLCKLIRHYLRLYHKTLLLHYITLHHIISNYITLHYIALHYIAYITSHYITLHNITLNCITLHFITLHYNILHYITLHYITLH